MAYCCIVTTGTYRVLPDLLNFFCDFLLVSLSHRAQLTHSSIYSRACAGEFSVSSPLVQCVLTDNFLWYVSCLNPALTRDWCLILYTESDSGNFIFSYN